MDDAGPRPAAPDESRATGYRGFLFSDLRGYTAFVERHGDEAAADLLDRYRRLVRSTVERFDGAEIRTEGDSFYVVFPAAGKAVLCGLAIVDAALAATAEDPAAPIRVGVGVHAGEAVEQGGAFVGQAVNIAARICSSAGPGEVLVSDVVRSLTRTSVAARFVPRGRRQLKGIAEPIFLFRALGPGARPGDDGGRVGWRRGVPIGAAALGTLGVLGAVLAATLLGAPGSVADPTGPGLGGSPLAGGPSPDPRDLIGFVDSNTGSVWTMLDDGSALRRLVGLGGIASARLSPDGQWVVVSRTPTVGGPGRIELFGTEGSGPIVLTGDPSWDDRSPAWSPDGLAIVFARALAAGGPPGLAVMNFDGSQLTMITAPEGGHDVPDWAPDDTRIAFTDFGAGPVIGVVSPDCTSLRSLGGLVGEEYTPRWSPDAGRIAFTGAVDGSATDVYTINGAGRDLVDLSGHKASDSDPAWSPDGRRIAFISNRTFESEIHVMNADGSDVRQLTNERGFAYSSLSWVRAPDRRPRATPLASGPSGGSLLPPVVSRPIGEGCPATGP